MNRPCIGLFGTCGKSTWRKEMFIPAYVSMGLVPDVDFFNPQVDDWKPELAQVEAQHLVDDSIILFPVTAETYGTGSLAETGFSIMQALKVESRRDVILMVDDGLDESLMGDKTAARESIRARALVKAHINKIHRPGVYLVQSMEDMLDLSIRLYKIQKLGYDLLSEFQKTIEMRCAQQGCTGPGN